MVRIDELARKLQERLLAAPGATHLGVECEEIRLLVEHLCKDPHLIEALGDMTGRCFRAQAQLEHAQETAQARWEERNGAREAARVFFPAYAAAEPEEGAFWNGHCPWLRDSAADERCDVHGAMRVRLEWKPQDCWIGAFWKVTPRADHPAIFGEDVDLWICLLPMLPLHLTWSRNRS